MRGRIQATFIAATLAIVGGCKVNMTADVYTTDLRDVAAGESGLTAPATMAFQVPGIDDCDEHTAEIAALMEGVLEDFSPKGCENLGMEAFLMASTQVPISMLESVATDAGSLFGLYVNAVDGRLATAVTLNLEKYELLSKRVKEKFFQDIELGQSKVLLSLNNDERGTARFIAPGSFVDGEPVLVEEPRSLERRHKAEILLSNVATSYLERHGSAPVFVLLPGG